MMSLLASHVGQASGQHAATFKQGDVFTQAFASSSNGLYQFRPDGTLVQSFIPSGIVWGGATVTRDSKLITTYRLLAPNVPIPGVSIFDANGNEQTFSTPEISIPGDVSVFKDGTLAISDQSNSIVLYSQDGTFLGNITHSIFDTATPLGNVVGPDDTLWVALLNSGVARFSRDGSYLGSFTPGFSVRDIGVDPFDGTIWIPAPDGSLNNYDPDGIELSSFMTNAAQPFLTGIAVAPDRSLYVTSLDSTELFRYSPDGSFLDSFEIPTRPIFVSVMTVPEPVGWHLLLFCLLILIYHFNSCRRRLVAKFDFVESPV